MLGRERMARYWLALARRHAGRDGARHLLADLRRRARAPAGAAHRLRARRRRRSPARSAASSTASRCGPTCARRTTPSQPARLPAAHLRRLAGPRRRRAAPHLSAWSAPERVALGTDYPFPLGEERARGADRVARRPRRRRRARRLLGGTALRVPRPRARRASRERSLRAASSTPRRRARARSTPRTRWPRCASGSTSRARPTAAPWSTSCGNSLGLQPVAARAGGRAGARGLGAPRRRGALRGPRALVLLPRAAARAAGRASSAPGPPRSWR